MARLRIYDSDGDITHPQEEAAESDIPPRVRQLPRKAVELYVEPENSRIVAYVKARTSLVDHGNRTAYYHAEYLADSMETLYSGLRDELETLASGCGKNNSHSKTTTGERESQNSTGNWWEWNNLMSNRMLPTPANDSARTEDTTGSKRTRTGDWEFDRSEKYCEYPWLLPSVKPELPETDSLLLDTFKSLLRDEKQLTLGMADHQHALRAIKLFTADIGCKAAVATYGRTEAIDDVPLVLQPGDYKNFEPIDESTREAVQNRRENLISQLFEQYKEQIREGVNSIVQHPQRSYHEKYAALNKIGLIFSDQKNHRKYGSEESLRKLASIADSIDDSEHLTSDERSKLRQFAKNAVKDKQQDILDQALAEATDSIISEINQEVNDFNTRFSLESEISAEHILKRIDKQLGQDTESTIQGPTVIGRRLSRGQPGYVVPLSVVVAIIILAICIILAAVLWVAWPVAPFDFGIDSIPFGETLRVTVPHQ